MGWSIPNVKISLSIIMVIIFLLTPVSLRSQQPITEFYRQDFSDWSDLSVHGDRPGDWINNSDPATYRVQSSGFYGTYLNLSDMPEITLDNNRTFSYDVKMTAQSDFDVDRFLRLYCYETDDVLFTATLKLWDRYPSISISTASEGKEQEISWEPSQWHTMNVSIVSIQSGVFVDLLYDYKAILNDIEIVNGKNLSVTHCSFYAYQNTIGTNDEMMVDNFVITNAFHGITQVPSLSTTPRETSSSSTPTPTEDDATSINFPLIYPNFYLIYLICIAITSKIRIKNKISK